MNLANYLTVSRILMAFLCVGFTLQDTSCSLIAAFILFIIASFTDFLDGFIARRRKKVSDLGKILDPIADKILILGIFLSFLVLDVVNIWMVIVIMAREFIITSVRLFGLSRGRVLEAKIFGKHKTVSQMAGIIIIFSVLILQKSFPQNTDIGFLSEKGILVLMWYIVIVTAVSGIHYLWDNRKIIRNF